MNIKLTCTDCICFHGHHLVPDPSSSFLFYDYLKVVEEQVQWRWATGKNQDRLGLAFHHTAVKFNAVAGWL